MGKRNIEIEDDSEQISFEEYLNGEALTLENLLEEATRLRARLTEYGNIRGDELIRLQTLRLKNKDELSALEAEIVELGQAELYIGDVWSYLDQALYYQKKHFHK